MRLRGTVVLGELESAVMEHYWAVGPCDAKSVHRAVGRPRRITLNTIQSTMKRLFTKGLLEREKVSHAHVYAPRVSREAFQRLAFDDLAKRLAHHETAGMLATFVDLAERAGDDTLARLEQLVAARLRERGKAR